MKQSDKRKQKSDWRICAIFLPHLSTATSTTTVVSTLHLLEPLAETIFVITGNLPDDAISSDKIHILDIGAKQKGNGETPILISIPRFMMMQLRISCNLLRVASKVDIVFFGAGAFTLFLPALLAKLMRKKIILLHLGLGAISRQDWGILYEKTLFGVGKHIFPWLVEILVEFNCRLADRIVVFLKDFTSPLTKKYGGKISFGGSRFYVDVNTFRAERSLDNRENVVGYIGRFEKVKGVMNFVQAIPLLLRESAGIKVVIGGDGPLKRQIEKEIKDANLSNKVTLMGWIPHHELPQRLNEIKLLVIPSYAEIGPHMVFEAMACGTPVLAAPVGVMRDVIKDGETGFTMEDNSPECITRNIIRALNNSNLNRIAGSARQLVEKEYTYEAAVERYRNIFYSLE